MNRSQLETEQLSTYDNLPLAPSFIWHVMCCKEAKSWWARLTIQISCSRAHYGGERSAGRSLIINGFEAAVKPGAYAGTGNEATADGRNPLRSLWRMLQHVGGGAWHAVGTGHINVILTHTPAQSAVMQHSPRLIA